MGLTSERVPAVAASLLHSADLPKERDFATVFYGGAPPSKQLAAEVKQRWPKAAMYVNFGRSSRLPELTRYRVQGYGMTETNAYVCSVAGGDYLERVSYIPLLRAGSEADCVAREYWTSCTHL